MEGNNEKAIEKLLGVLKNKKEVELIVKFTNEIKARDIKLLIGSILEITIVDTVTTVDPRKK